MADYTPTLGEYTELKPFRFWCQKVLPLVYDDSLSYYELLCKVVDYLNKTMEDVDTLHDDVVNLHAAYVQLQTYVNTYFDNLDVQEEINNKLDDMVTSGELVQILSPTIADEVADWLSEHLTPTTPAIDNTLTVSGAGADAKVTGDTFKLCLESSKTFVNSENVSNYNVLTNLPVNKIYFYGNSALPSVTDKPDFVDGFTAFIINYSIASKSGATLFCINNYTNEIALKTARTVDNAIVWSGFYYLDRESVKGSKTFINSTNVSNYNKLSLLPVNQIFFYGVSAVPSVTDKPNFTNAFTVLTANYSTYSASGASQICIEQITNRMAIRTARLEDETLVYSDWLYFNGDINYLDMDEITEDKVLNFNGVETSTAYTTGYAISDYIPCEYGDLIYLPYIHGYNFPAICAYDENKTFLWSYAGKDGVNAEEVFASINIRMNDRRAKYFRYNIMRNNQFSWGSLAIYIDKGSIDDNYDNILRVNTTISNRYGYFNKLIDAINYVNTYNLLNRTIELYAPNYLVVNDFSEEYYAAIPRLSVQNIYAGYILKNNVTIKGIGNTRLTFNYSGDSLNNVADNFSIFNVAGNCNLENLRIIAQNCKYAIHDDIGASGQSGIPMFHFSIKNCSVTHNGISESADYQYPCCIGGGCFSGSKHIIENCIFNNQGWSSDISYHDSESSRTGVQSVVIITGCYFYKRIRLANMSSASGDNALAMINNTSTASANTIGDHFDVLAFNNTIRA